MAHPAAATLSGFAPEDHRLSGVRFYSSDKRPSFFGSLLKNLKDEYTKSSEMQESLKKFREDAQKLEESDALKEVRQTGL